MTITGLISLCAAVVLTAGAAELGLAQTTPTPTAESAHKKTQVKRVTGIVTSASADAITVEGRGKGKEAEWTFSAGPNTVVKKAGKAITVADLQAGDHVIVRYIEKEGKAVARSVTVTGGTTAKRTGSTEKPQTK